MASQTLQKYIEFVITYRVPLIDIWVKKLLHEKLNGNNSTSMKNCHPRVRAKHLEWVKHLKLAKQFTHLKHLSR